MNSDLSGRGFQHRACRQCGGDGFFDGSDDSGRCLQCGRPIALAVTSAPSLDSALAATQEVAPSTRHSAESWMARHRQRRREINSSHSTQVSKLGSI